MASLVPSFSSNAATTPAGQRGLSEPFAGGQDVSVQRRSKLRGIPGRLLRGLGLLGSAADELPQVERSRVTRSEALELLAGGEVRVREWNALRRAGSEFPALQELDLSGRDLAGIDLSELFLYGTRLDGADLTGANLAAADLTTASLRGARLRGATLAGADLCRADFRDAELGGASLAGAVLHGTRFMKSDA